jgi:hypothetical protein
VTEAHRGRDTEFNCTIDRMTIELLAPPKADRDEP